MRLKYNSPVILTFTILAFTVLITNIILGGLLTPMFFTAYPGFGMFTPFGLIGSVGHILGHANWAHYSANFLSILLVGPLLEEKYGSKKMLFMIALTAVATSFFNAVFFPTGLKGASGIVFMMLILASCTDFKTKQIPITLVLASAIFLGREFVGATRPDNISQFSHIFGGLMGAGFGLFMPPKK
ncbi:MAG: rhomboid family intramembrane serine protease [Patescibacteria group bacterium]